MNSITAFLAMGGYAAFVWPAFAVTFIVLAGMLGVSLRALRRREAALARLQRKAGPSAAPARAAASAGRGARA